MFPSRYSADQRDAVATAIVDRGIKSRRVCEMAERGELELDGRRLEPFALPESTARGWASDLRRRRAGERRRSPSASPAERAAAMRVALGDELDEAIGRLKKARRSGEPPDERYFRAHRAATAALKEFESLGDDPPPSGAKGVVMDGERVGPLLAAAMRSPRQPPDDARGDQRFAPRVEEEPEALEPEALEPEALEPAALSDPWQAARERFGRELHDAIEGNGGAAA